MGMPRFSRTVGKLTMWSSSATHLQRAAEQQPAGEHRQFNAIDFAKQQHDVMRDEWFDRHENDLC